MRKEQALHRPFLEKAAMCQVRAAMELYRKRYYQGTVQRFRHGQPATFEKANQNWNGYVLGASSSEVCVHLG